MLSMAMSSRTAVRLYGTCSRVGSCLTRPVAVPLGAQSVAARQMPVVADRRWYSQGPDYAGLPEHDGTNKVLPIAARHSRTVAIDGVTPYAARVSLDHSGGLTLDLGVDCLCKIQKGQETPHLENGTGLLVYPVRRIGQGHTMRMLFSLTPSHVIPAESLPMDGVTPVTGRVHTHTRTGGLFVDLGTPCGCHVTPESVANSGHAQADFPMETEIQVYITWASGIGKVDGELVPRQEPLVPFSQLAVDGQTPIKGIVERETRTLPKFPGEEAFMVRVACAYDIHVTRAHDDPPLTLGQELEVYPFAKSWGSKLIRASLKPTQQPGSSIQSLTVGDKLQAVSLDQSDGFGGKAYSLGAAYGSGVYGWIHEQGDNLVGDVPAGSQVEVTVASVAPMQGTAILLPSNSTRKISDQTVEADGVTAMKGRVISSPSATIHLMDIGTEQPAVLPRAVDDMGVNVEEHERAWDALSEGSEVDVYPQALHGPRMRVLVALAARHAPRVSAQVVQADPAKWWPATCLSAVESAVLYVDCGWTEQGVCQGRNLPHSLKGALPGTPVEARIVAFAKDGGRALVQLRDPSAAPPSARYSAPPPPPM